MAWTGGRGALLPTLTLAAVAFFGAGMAALHALVPELDPAREPMSAYGISAFAPLFTAVLVVLALGILPLVAGLRRGLARPALGSGLLALALLALLELGPESAMGAVQRVFAALVLGGVAVAAWRLRGLASGGRL